MSDRAVADLIDAALEAAVVPSFTKIGPAVRRRLDRWTTLDGHDLGGRSALVTGATSGLGRCTASTLARLGATVIITGRDERRVHEAAREIEHRAEPTRPERTGGERTGERGRVVPIVADMGELDQVRRLADAVGAVAERLDVLVHNAGALSAARTVNGDGIEQTVASQVAGQFLLTTLLLPRLRPDERGGPARVLAVTSGGMYTAPLTVDDLQMAASDYSGSEQYARAKRAQVTLNEMWAAVVPHEQIVFHAMHPGWVDTPGIRASLPRFRRVMAPLLRSASDGADTLVWLAADERAAATSGELWLDRRVRPIHRLRRTRRSDTAGERARLWTWCETVTGVSPELARR